MAIDVNTPAETVYGLVGVLNTATKQTELYSQVENPGRLADANAACDAAANALGDLGFGSGGSLPATDAVVSDTDTVTVSDAASGSATAVVAVAANAITSITLADTVALLEAGTYEEVGGGSITVTVTDGVPTFTYVAP